MATSLRDLPKVDRFYDHPRVIELKKKYEQAYLTLVIREILEEERKNFREGLEPCTSLEELVAKLILRVEKPFALKKVINATGIVLHTNLGRSPLDERVFEHMKWVSSGYSNLEYNLEKGERGSRYDHVSEHLCALTGAEDAHVVNNNAAAVLLILSTFAKDRAVVVSRSELVEIGGSFRIPSIMELSGAQLREIGTTNRTHLYDYEQAIDEQCAMLMKVHRSNFFIEGFTKEVSTQAISELAKAKDVLSYEDLGSGAFAELCVDLSLETVRQKMAQGLDLLSLSGDKLIGGPQAGVILGKASLIKKLKQNQLTRALRVDKLTLSALEVVLVEHLQNSGKNVKAIRFLERKQDDIHEQTLRMKDALEKLGFACYVCLGTSLVGGGSLPQVQRESWQLHIEQENIQLLSEHLRRSHVPVITKLQSDRMVLDFRCVEREEEELFLEAFGTWSAK